MGAHKKSLLFCVLFCILIAILAGYDLRLSLVKAEHKARDQVAHTSFMIDEWIKGAFTASDYVLRDIVTEVPVDELEYPTTDQESHAKISRYINEKRMTLPNAVGVGLNDKNCIVTHTPSIVGFDASGREWCRVPMRNPEIETFVSNMFLSNIGDLMVIQARRFPGDEGFNGLAGVGVDLAFFSKWLEKVSIAPHMVLAISDENLNLLARKPALPEALGKKVEAPFVKAFVDSREAYTTFSGVSPLDGEPRLYGVRKVEGLPFVVIAGIAARDWQANWVHRAWVTGVAVVILWLMAILTLRYDWHRLDTLRDLKTARDELAVLSVTDALTGLANRRRLDDGMDAEYRRMCRMKAPLSIVMIDIDYFKMFNDTYGHVEGDECLRIVGAIIKKMLKRPQDLAARYGGEEFCCLLPGTNHEDAVSIATAIKDGIAAAGIPHATSSVANHVTVSVGVATVVCDGVITLEQAVKMADERLYQAKVSGRNRVCYGTS